MRASTEVRRQRRIDKCRHITTGNRWVRVKDGYFVYCPYCQASGPTKPTTSEASEAFCDAVNEGSLT